MSIQMTLMFAPGYTSENYPGGMTTLSIDQQIDAFEKRYKIWFLDIAQNLVNTPDSGFAVLTILNAYPELFAQLNGYQGDKLALFQQGTANIFPDIYYRFYPDGDLITKHLYSYMRNSLAHMSFTGNDVILSENFPAPLEVLGRNGIRVVCVNPRKWYERIQFHFERYIEALKNPDNADLRNKFSARLNQPF